MARRFFVDRKNISNGCLTISGQEHIHLTKVLRAKIGDEIVVSTNDCFELKCKILSINKTETTLNIESEKKLLDNTLDITLFQAVMKGEHMEMLVQKSTELNIKTFVPFESKFVVAKVDEKKIERFKKISMEACKQSNRGFPMDIKNVISFEKLLGELKNYEQIVFAYENSRKSAKEIIEKLDKTKKTALIVGCEGGFSEDEEKRLTIANAKAISLGKNILRGETAGITLVSIIMYAFDQFN